MSPIQNSTFKIKNCPSPPRLSVSAGEKMFLAVGLSLKTTPHAHTKRIHDEAEKGLAA